MNYNELLALVKQQQDHIAILEQENIELTNALNDIQNKIESLYTSYTSQLNSN